MFDSNNNPNTPLPPQKALEAITLISFCTFMAAGFSAVGMQEFQMIYAAVGIYGSLKFVLGLLR